MPTSLNSPARVDTGGLTVLLLSTFTRSPIALSLRPSLHGLQEQGAQCGGSLFRLLEFVVPQLRDGASVHALLRGTSSGGAGAGGDRKWRWRRSQQRHQLVGRSSARLFGRHRQRTNGQ